MEKSHNMPASPLPKAKKISQQRPIDVLFGQICAGLKSDFQSLSVRRQNIWH
jgi:hypothetical protein